MALTISLDMPKKERIGRSMYLLSGTIAFDDDYQTGGMDASGITKYFKNCLRLICDGRSGYIFEFDKSNKKIKVFHPTRINAASGTVNDSLGFATGENTLNAENAARDISNAGKEVAASTNLSSLTGVSFIAIGV
jgi:hypothetical protein